MTRLRAGAATDTGRVRTGNEDTPLVADDAGLWAVADGMGGHQAGEVASQLAVEVLRDRFSAVAPTEDALADATAAANTAVVEAAAEDPDLRGMGTTLVAIARTEDDDLAYVNVGDSRLYLLRDGELSRLTIDHSLVEELVQEGSISPEEAKTHPKRNIVTRALGIAEWVKVDASTITPYEGDRYLLCSDGLTNEVEEDRIASVLRRLADPTEAAKELVSLANQSGGRDNITVVVVDVVDDEGRAEAASQLVGASTASSDDLAGFSAAIGDEAAAAAPAPPSRRERRRARAAQRPPRPITWRVAIFALLFVAVLGVAAAAIGWYARNTYFVGVQGDSVTIFRGKPGGVLWLDPTVEESTDLQLDDLTNEARDDVQRGVEFGDLAEAEAYLGRVTTTTTTSTTSTTTTSTTSTTAPVLPPPAAPTTAPAAPPPSA